MAIVLRVDLYEQAYFALTFAGDHPIRTNGAFELDRDTEDFRVERWLLDEIQSSKYPVLQLRPDRCPLVGIHFRAVEIETPSPGSVQDVLDGVIHGAGEQSSKRS